MNIPSKSFNDFRNKPNRTHKLSQAEISILNPSRGRKVLPKSFRQLAQDINLHGN